MIIYKIKNNINNKIYIGLTTKDLSKRIAEHVSENRSYIQKALNKYGIQSFNVSVIDSAESREILCEKERYWIQHYNCKVPNGYNLTDGGDGLVNPSEIVRKRISDTLKKKHLVTKGFTGRKHTEESKRKTSETLKEVFSSPEIRKKMSDARKGKVISEEQKQKISKAKTGVKRTDIVWNKGLKMSSVIGYVNPMKGKKRPDLSERNRLDKGKTRTFSNPEERARKISESRKGKKYPRRQGIYLAVSNQ
jgi:group I intron endonuclease